MYLKQLFLDILNTVVSTCLTITCFSVFTFFLNNLLFCRAPWLLELLPASYCRDFSAWISCKTDENKFTQCKDAQIEMERWEANFFFQNPLGTSNAHISHLLPLPLPTLMWLAKERYPSSLPHPNNLWRWNSTRFKQRVKISNLSWSY